MSDKMEKTVVVLVESPKTHPLYGKSYKRSKKYLVDDGLSAKIGDIVEFVQCRPVSKRKHWRVEKIVGRDEVALGTEEMKETAQEAIAEVLPEPVETSEVSESVVEEVDGESGKETKRQSDKEVKGEEVKKETKRQSDKETKGEEVKKETKRQSDKEVKEEVKEKKIKKAKKETK